MREITPRCQRVALAMNALILALSGLLFGAPAFSQLIVGEPRPATVHIPPSYDGRVPMALLIHLHGYWSQGNQTEIDQYRFPGLADEFGFLYAAPEGTPDAQGQRYWNATPACCGPASSVDDSGYLQALIQEIRSRLNVDANRIYLTGFSTGGFMSYRLACDASSSIAALVSIAGATYEDPADCAASSPVHVLQVHGAADTSINPSGGRTASRPGDEYPGALETIRQWAGFDGCPEPPETGTVRDLLSSIPGEETKVTRFMDGCAEGGSAELWLSSGADHWSYLSQPQFARQAVEWLFDHPKKPAPVAIATFSPREGAAPLQVVADSTASSNSEGSIAGHFWRFGDGAAIEGETATHTYTEPGRYLASLTVVSEDARSSRRARNPVIVQCPAGDTGPWTPAPVGNPQYPGSAWLEDTLGQRVLRLCAGGLGFTGRTDECLFLYQRLSGDFRLTAEVTDVTTEVEGAFVGLMARAGLDGDAPFVGAMLEATGQPPIFQGLVRGRSRNAPGAVVRADGRRGVDRLGAWLRLKRRGNVLSASVSPDGQEFELLHELTIDGWPESVLVGIAAAGRDLNSNAESFHPLQASAAHLSLESGGPSFLRAYSNADGTLDISDPVRILESLFLGAEPPACPAATDANGDDLIDISDAIFALGYLFLCTGAPPAPFPDCGADPTPEALGCDAHGPCSG